MRRRFAGCIAKGRLLAPFVFLAAAFVAAAANAACQPTVSGEQATVDKHYDGDTLRLSDGRRLRLLGIDTPEMNYRKGAPQALATTALHRLQSLLPRGGTLRLVPDRQQHDRYGRLLAHTYTPDGVSVEETLLREGLAVSFILPPNLAQADCLLAAERAARMAHRGVWALPAYRPQAATGVRADGSYRLVRGKVSSAMRRGNWILLKLDRRVQLRIARTDWGRFSPTDHLAWRGQTVIARGKLQVHNGQPTLRLWHPAQLERSN